MIRNDDMALFSITADVSEFETFDSVDAPDGGSAIFEVTLSNTFEGVTEVTVQFSTIPITALGNDVDYTTINSQTVRFLEGGPLTQTVTVFFNQEGEFSPGINVDVVESDETFQVRILDARFDDQDDASRVMIDPAGETRIGTILDDDDAMMMVGPPVSGSENSIFTFLVTLDGRIGEDVTLTASTANGTATNPEDFVLLDENDNEVTQLPITFTPNDNPLTTPGTSTAIVRVRVDEDGLQEPMEDFQLVLENLVFTGTQANNPTPITFSNGQPTLAGTGLIDASEDPAEVRFSAATLLGVSGMEGNETDSNQLSFVVELSQAVQGTVTVDVETNPVSSNDFTPINTTLTFSSDNDPDDDGDGNPLTQTVVVDLAGDEIVEPDETFQLMLSNVGVIGLNPTEAANLVTLAATTTATGTIENDDTAILDISDVSLVEGDVGTTIMEFNVILNSEVQGGVTVDFTTLAGVDNPATLGDDFLDATDELTFTGNFIGETQTVRVTIQGDLLTERDETFLVQLSNLVSQNVESISLRANNGATGPTATVTGTIQNNDSILVTGPGSTGGSHVRVLDQNGGVRFELFPVYPGFTGGVRVATGDVTGDGVPDIITAPGPGMATIVKVFDGITGAPLNQFEVDAYPGFQGGVFIAVADFDDDDKVELVTGTDVSGGSGVRVYDFDTATFTNDFYAYPNFFGGVRVATGDVTGDGVPDIITGPGPGGGPNVRVFSLADQPGAFAFQTGVTLNSNEFGGIGNFFAFPQSFTDGIYVAAGDFGGALRSIIVEGNETLVDVADIVVGTGSAPETGAFVRVFDSVDGSFDQFEGFRTFGGGVRVGTVERADNIPGVTNRVDLIAARGPGGNATIHIFAGQQQAPGDPNFVNVDQNTDMALIEDRSLFFTGTENGGPNRGVTPVAPAVDVYGNFMGGVFAAGTSFEAVQGSPLFLDPSAPLLGGTANLITTAQAAPIVDAATARLQAAGLNAPASAKLANTQVVVQNLAPGLLGLALGNVIFLDDDAAGAGWFIDPTPLTSEEFFQQTQAGLAATSQAAIGRVDLLSVILHELGHVLGLEDLAADEHQGHVMAETLAPGIRRVPDEHFLDELFASDDLMDSLFLNGE